MDSYRFRLRRIEPTGLLLAAMLIPEQMAFKRGKELQACPVPNPAIHQLPAAYLLASCAFRASPGAGTRNARQSELISTAVAQIGRVRKNRLLKGGLRPMDTKASTNAIVLALCLWIGCAQADSITTLYNTGVDDHHRVLPNNSPDPHYTMTVLSTWAVTVPLTATSAGGWPIPPWIEDNEVSTWIAPTGNSLDDALDNHPGDAYIYTTTFDLSAYRLNTVEISGRWATDFQGANIVLNGVSLGFVSLTPYTWAGFTLPPSRLRAGVNTLAFVVSNDMRSYENPTGLRVELTGTAVIPEPATFALFGIAISGMVVRHFRRSRPVS